MKKHTPILIILAVVFAVAVANFVPNTFLTGWDNLHPEFNFSVNIKRSLFAVWQEYQGTGLLGGMGHATDLLHQLFLSILSLIVPTSFIRYIWTFLTLLIGSIGAYYLIAIILKSNPKWEMTSLLGAIFYLLNLATVQTYYIIFETFSAHFAALPWLLLTTIRYCQNPTRKNFILFALVLLLSTPSFYVPTLFVVSALACILLAIFLTRFSFSTGRLLTIIVLVNAFWLLPFTLFTLTHSQINLDAKINQMATETIFLQNKEFGNVWDTMLLKGFWFNSIEPNPDGNYAYVFAPWREYVQNPFISGFGYILFSIIAIGLIVSTKKRSPLLLGVVALFLLSFTLLTTATPPFSWFNSLLREYIPLFNQVFRFPFTKFSILASLTYSIFFAIGIQAITSILKENKKLILTSYLLFLTFLIIFSLPIFKGHLFYEKERLQIPQEYFELFDFFKHQDQNTRIADFPQHTFWGWNFYRWGYSGSGFLWYGIKQPILSRTFDPWSAENENYYFEISHALHTQNSDLFEQVLNKYQVKWLLVDKNVFNPVSPSALFFDELEKLTSTIPSIHKQATFGNLEVYSVDLKIEPENFVFLSNGDLPKANHYQWGNYDQAYSDYGNYIADGKWKMENRTSSFYPFRSLFSGKTQQDITFNVKEDKKSIEFTATLPAQESLLEIPDLLQYEDMLPITILLQRSGKNRITLSALIETPAVSLNGQKVWGNTVVKPLFEVPASLTSQLRLTINGVVTMTITPSDLKALLDSSEEQYNVGSSFIVTDQDNVFMVSLENDLASQTEIISSAQLSALPGFAKQDIPVKSGDVSKLIVEFPKVEDGYINFHPIIADAQKSDICESFRNDIKKISITNDRDLALQTKNATECIAYYAHDLPQAHGYVLFTESRNEKGRGLHIWVENITKKLAVLDTYLPSNKNITKSTFIIPPQGQFGKSYAFHFDNIAIGPQETVNILRDIAVYPIPYRFLTSMKLTNPGAYEDIVTESRDIRVSHPNESLYIVDVADRINKQTLILSQSYDSGWKAYQVQSSKFKVQSYLQLAFPFLFGKEIKDHVLVNNWENGWILDSSKFKVQSSKLVIVYLPQYLEYAGFGLLGITFAWLLFTLRKVRS